VTLTARPQQKAPAPGPLDQALESIAARAATLDADPRLPRENLEDLARSGVLEAAPRQPGPLAYQIALIRAVAAVDASTARILDGHINAAERLLTAQPGSVAEAELAAVAGGRLWLGVWGADPVAGEGRPARLERTAAGQLVLSGVKVFCSGAGGVQRALVVAFDERDERRLAYVDTTGGLEIDARWYRAHGLRSSESHRVTFDAAIVLAVLGGPGELARQPFFARDAVRTAATWAGLCDALASATARALAERGEADAHQDGALGRLRLRAEANELWLIAAARRLEQPGRSADDCAQIAASTRAALFESCAAALRDAVAATGSRGPATVPLLDRARRDLDVFLLQHRVEPSLEALGRAARLAAAGRPA
jgi:hypothetical protein